jgi:drug/metabolite transporter (DMT)-like permease
MIQFGLGRLHLTTGTRLVTAIRSSLIGRLQIPLAPCLGWLAFGEVPEIRHLCRLSCRGDDPS